MTKRHAVRSKTANLRNSTHAIDTSQYEANITEAERIALAMHPVSPILPEHERNAKLRARITLRRFSWEK